MKAAVPAESSVIHLSSASLFSCVKTHFRSQRNVIEYILLALLCHPLWHWIKIVYWKISFSTSVMSTKSPLSCKGVAIIFISNFSGDIFNRSLTRMNMKNYCRRLAWHCMCACMCWIKTLLWDKFVESVETYKKYSKLCWWYVIVREVHILGEKKNQFFVSFKSK